MKNLILTFLVLGAIIGCKKKYVEPVTPDCILEKIEQNKSHLVDVARATYHGETTYYFHLSKIGSCLLSENCDTICHEPNLAAIGCKDYIRNRTDVSLIYQK